MDALVCFARALYVHHADVERVLEDVAQAT